MKAYDSGSIRNVAVVGHGGAGKTQLIAALLHTAGATPRLGRVDDGTTVTDYDDEEIARKHTLSASLAWAEWNKTKINFIDTPGMGNFLSDARAGLRVADAALVVVDAVSGVEVQTEKVWAEADALGLPRLVVVNRLDRERSSLNRTLASVREALSRTIIPVQLPIGEERGFGGVINLVGMKAWTYASDGSGKATEGPVPFELSEIAGTAREQLIEMVAEADDALMERSSRPARSPRTNCSTGFARQCSRERSRRCCAPPAWPRLAHPRCSTRWSGTCPRPSIGRSRRPIRSRTPR